MSDSQAIGLPDQLAIAHALRSIVNAMAALSKRVDALGAEQREHARLLTEITSRLDSLTADVSTWNGQALLFDRRTESAERLIHGTRNIVMQAEHQMQQGIASIDERLVELTADVQRLRLLRESPEGNVDLLREEIAALQHHLAGLEHQTGSSQ